MGSRLRVPAVGAALTLLVVAGVVPRAPGWSGVLGPTALANTEGSPEALARRVMDAMQAGDLDRLRALALTEQEFRAHVWPALPAARPERNVPFDFVWERLEQNSEGHLRQTVAATRGAPLTLRQVRFAGPASRYGDVVVRRSTELVLAAPDGTEWVVRLFGSTIEQDGRYKVFSYVVGD